MFTVSGIVISCTGGTGYCRPVARPAVEPDSLEQLGRELLAAWVWFAQAGRDLPAAVEQPADVTDEPAEQAWFW